MLHAAKPMQARRLGYSARMGTPETPSRALWTILLAAGGSRRLGEPKQLLRLHGKPLLLHAVQVARAVTGSRIVIVLGAHAPRLRAMLARQRRDVRIAYNRDWATGMASSMRCGLAFLPHGARAALLMLSDQPRIRPRALRRLARAWIRRPGRAAAAYYLGAPGVPAILPRRMFRRARALSGDTGARALLRADAGTLSLLKMPEAAVDIDTPADRRRL
jgi:molybdenum cofactor cytidylyltransferase